MRTFVVTDCALHGLPQGPAEVRPGGTAIRHAVGYVPDHRVDEVVDQTAAAALTLWRKLPMMVAPVRPDEGPGKPVPF